MAKNDFSTESAVNYEQKCLCVLVLDVSGSMREVVDGDVKFTGRKEMIDGQLYDIVEGGVTKLDGLNEGLKDFYNEIYQDDNSSQRIEVALIAFNDTVQKLQDPALVENFTMPTLEASGDTAVVDAMMSAIDLVEQRKEWYKSTGQPYYRPWIILMTDGEPNANQNIQSLADRIKSDTSNKKYVFLPIGVAGANMDILHQIEGEGSGKIPAMPLQGAKFSNFFKWLSSSIGTVINSREGDRVSFEDPTDWMNNFYNIG